MSKTSWRLVEANLHAYIYEDKQHPWVKYLMPRHRWAQMCQGVWPWRMW